MKAFLMFLAAMLVGCAPAKEAGGVAWPDLESVGFVSGRVATAADVEAGRAAFAVGSGAQPLVITLPQYAFHVDVDTKQRTPCVIIQAEEAGGYKVVGCRKLDGSYLVGTLPEFELLGVYPRKSERSVQP